MMDDDFADLYSQLFGKALAEPETQEDVKNILNCIRTRNGHLDDDDKAQLRQSSDLLLHKVQLFANNSKKILAQFTKAICNQLYDDPYRFFYEIIQNADDANYKKAEEEKIPPRITFRLTEQELVVESNEDGFSLANVIAICSTGQSSKSNDAQTTGEKGFGFKAVFGIASRVHIQSRLWSFSFQHERHEDGIGMVTPIWEQPTCLPEKVRTRITLKYAFNENFTLADLCDRIESQPVTIVSSLRNITKVEIHIDNVLRRQRHKSFEKLAVTKSGYYQFAETADGQQHLHHFRVRHGTVQNMPAREGRDSSTQIAIYFPVHDFGNCEPLIDPQGQYVFAYLPVRRVPQLPFLIQADFVLPASRQDITDNLWNRKLRDGIAGLFARSMRKFASETEHALRFRWTKYLPQSPMADFWKDLSGLIKEKLRPEKVFVGEDNGLFLANDVRLLPSYFLHRPFLSVCKPLLPAPTDQYTYLSQRYSTAEYAVLRGLGVTTLSSQEVLDVICQDSKSSTSYLRQFSLNDTWHDTYAKALKTLLDKGVTECGSNIKAALRDSPILPVRNGCELEWWSITSRNVYFPVLVDEGSGSNQVKIIMPTDLSLVVAHPDAVCNVAREGVYRLLGVQSCATSVICNSIRDASKFTGTKTHANMLAHLELLFWYSQRPMHTLRANTEGSHYAQTSGLFFQSEKSFDAEKAVGLRTSDGKRDSLLHACYQNSQMRVHVRNGMTWLEWLQKVAKIRWFPPLEDSTYRDQLHWTFEDILKDNPTRFIPLLQAQWSEEYAATCRFNSQIAMAVKQAVVPCLGSSKQKLMDSWFPSKHVLDLARQYHVENLMGILDLPESQNGVNLNDWPSLRDLGINHGIGLNFYKKILVVIANAGEKFSVEASLMSKLYREIGSSATLNDQKDLQALFATQKLIWDTKSKLWRTSGDCVWSSEVPLMRKFVITSCYNLQAAQGLFKTLLQIGDITYQDLTNELEDLRLTIRFGMRNEQVSPIYSLLDKMATNTETEIFLRSYFKSRAGIYCNGHWSKSDNCVWHESINIGNHVPIKAAFPSLQHFFVNILRVNTISDEFMMRELAKAATASTKDRNTIKKLMLDTSAILTSNSKADSFDCTATLKTARFLPCITPDGSAKYLTITDDFFIPNDNIYVQAFQGRLYALDFTYSELNTLHPLINLLQLDGKYLAQNVLHQTEEGDSSIDDALTAQLRECAYAISCCAVFHRSPLYFNHAVDIHNLLREVVVCTSPNIRTTFSVKQGKAVTKVSVEKASLIIKKESGTLRIIMPQSKLEQKSCLRSDLPKGLAKELQILDAHAVSQIYRLINELDMGTDQLLQEEGIPHTDEWLSKTERAPPPSAPVFTRPELEAVSASSPIPINVGAGSIVWSSTQSGMFSYQSRQPYITIPAEVNHRIEAPEYQRVLDHVRRQAVDVKWRNAPRENATASTNDHTRFLNDQCRNRGSSIDPFKYPELFGSDEYVQFRMGAVGELFAFEVLKSLLGVKMTLDHWPSKIRHYVRAHPHYENIPCWTQAETADITYTDDESLDLENSFRQRSIGDYFDDWFPQWLSESSSCEARNGNQACENRNCARCSVEHRVPLEWLFEVKTTLGPCETDLFMSQSQYNRMRDTGYSNSTDCKKVYCLVRVYDLLTDCIGLRIYIDSWRFKDVKLEFNTTDKWRVKAS